MRFKVDENLPVEVAEMLRQAGHDAATVLEQHLGGSDDAQLAALCQLESRILVTLDMDFSDIRSYPPTEYPGLVVLRLRQQDKPHVLWMYSCTCCKCFTKSRLKGTCGLWKRTGLGFEERLDSVPPLHADPPAQLSAYTSCWPPDRLPLAALDTSFARRSANCRGVRHRHSRVGHSSRCGHRSRLAKQQEDGIMPSNLTQGANQRNGL